MQDDNELMELVKNGDKQAYNKIVMKHRIPAISFAYSFLSDLHAAEDVVQDVFVNIYINRNSYKPIFTFKTYLYQSIRNKSIDILRKNKSSVNLDSLNEIAADYSTEETVINNENIKFIFHILNGLENDYKTALYLFSIENMSYEQIAKIMRKTIPQVKIIIFRGRKKLKKAYKEVL